MKRLRIAYNAPVAGALVFGFLAAAGCTPRAGSSSGAPDASVSFAQSNLVTNPATWNSLYGSWPALRYDHGMVYDSDLKRIVVFGGRGGASGPHFGDLWEWDSTKGSWNQRTPGGRTPYDRSQPAMFYDTVRKKTVMFSGWQPGAGFYHPDQWEWDGAAQTWTERQLTTQPSARYGASIVWDSARGKAVLFGGFDEATGRRNDTWEWDGTAWTERTPTGTKPTPRHSALMAFDSMRNKTVLFSGNSGNGVATAGTWVDETWEWDGTAGTWTKITAPSITSTQWSSGYTSMVYDPVLNKIVLYYYYNYVWTYTPGTGATGTWADAPTQTKIDSALPGYYNPGLVYDDSQQAIVVFGGQSSGRSLWQLTTTDFNWTNRSAPANGPIQRQYPSMAVNGKTGKLIVFGGHSSVDNLYKQDIWEWSGTDEKLTNQTTGGTKPDPRNQAGLVYDSARDRFLLFGGYGTGAYDDLWAWAPATREWTQISLTGARPSARYGHWMFYDAARDKVYVFGQNQGSYVNWEYDPALNTWKDRTVTSPPPGVSRSYFDVAFDTNRGKIIICGGYYNSVYNTDIWEWDTTTGVWAQLMPTTGTAVPDGRYYPTVAYDSIRRVMLLVGGYKQITGATGPANDSWEWDANLLRWTETTPPGVKPAPRYQHLMVFNPLRGTTYLFGGTVPDDTAYGPSEFWEYLPNAAARPIGAGCTPAMASACASGNCVDGVCCTQASCGGTCKSCNVAGLAGTCSNVPAGLSDETCPSDQACDAAQACKKRLGQSCNLFSECATGNCVDGVCCDTACNDKCKQCNLASKRGTCSFVPAGDEDPVGSPACVSEPDVPRQCDGAGTCTNTPKPTGRSCTAGGQCATGYCIDGYCCNSGCAQTCYRCDKPGALGSCSARAAGEQDLSATTPCDQSNQTCNASAQCVTNKKPNGGSCQAATECGSNNCVDQICCSSTCTGTCQSCAVPGSLGTCVNVVPGSQDANAATACSGAQYCDTAGTCQSGLKPNGNTCAGNTECGSSKCVDGVCCDKTCTEACYTCNLPGGTPGECVGLPIGSADTACPGANYCDGMHKCTTGKKPNGATCAGDNECASNVCVDGTCCESACTGDCKTCKNTTGTCVNVAQGMDPRGMCKGDLAACGGSCDGQGRCSFAPQGKSCRPAGCQPDLNLITTAGTTCDGAGHCSVTAAATTDCGGFGCYTDTNGAAQCKKDCATDPDCAIKRYCDAPADGGAGGAAGSQCPPQFPLGHACVRNPQCLSGTCAIPTGATVGICCNVACDKCGSCDATGTCIFTAAGTRSPDCMDSLSDPSGMCGGVCDGHAHCTYPNTGTTCGTCKTCNGGGLCNLKPDDDANCGTIECDGLDDNQCLDYHDLTSKRCASLGSCKTPNTVAGCTDVTNTCTGGGGAGGRGGAGGSTGSGGSSAGSSARGGSTGTAGSGAAGTTGTDGGAGSGGGGGGGCCAIGASDSPNALVGLLVFASVMFVRRRRR